MCSRGECVAQTPVSMLARTCVQCSLGVKNVLKGTCVSAQAGHVCSRGVECDSRRCPVLKGCVCSKGGVGVSLKGCVVLKGCVCFKGCSVLKGCMCAHQG